MKPIERFIIGKKKDDDGEKYISLVVQLPGSRWPVTVVGLFWRQLWG